ncbi:MAG: hypothetical protein K5669_05310, partial [Lachnospiraceae bacterium]|nr:hypothetical protein [Lachnospiraceae bacterium]
MKNNISNTILTALMTVTFVTAILLTGCGKNGNSESPKENSTAQDGALNDDNSGEVAGKSGKEENTDFVDPLMASISQKDEDTKEEIPSDYQYSLDDMGFLDIGE